MARVATSFVPNRVRRLSPDELLGPLNAVERQNAPGWLWVEGDVSLLGAIPRVSVVGARTASPDGLRRAGRLARELVAHEVVVVSGLARGVDTVAHQTAIRAGGRTVAVLGTSIDQPYPKENYALQRAIAAEHLVVSQFAPGQPNSSYQLPSAQPHHGPSQPCHRDRGSGRQQRDSLPGVGSVASGAGAVHPREPGAGARPLVARRDAPLRSSILVSTEQVLEVLPPVMEGSLAELAF